MRCERSPEPICPLRCAAARIRQSLPLLLVEPGAQDLHGQAAVLMLRFLGRDDDEPGRQMGDAHGRIRLVDVLAAGAAGAHGVDADVLGADVEVDVLRLRQHGDGGGRGVDAPARLGGGNALHAVDARLVLEAGKHALARDRRHDLLVAAEIVLRQADDLGLPAALLGIAAVHAEEVGREQRGLVAAGAGAHLQDGALLVGRVLGQEVATQVLFELGHAPFEPPALPSPAPQGPLSAVGSSISAARSRPLGLGLAQRLDGGNHRIELGKTPS